MHSLQLVHDDLFKMLTINIKKKLHLNECIKIFIRSTWITSTKETNCKRKMLGSLKLKRNFSLTRNGILLYFFFFWSLQVLLSHLLWELNFKESSDTLKIITERLWTIKFHKLQVRIKLPTNYFIYIESDGGDESVKLHIQESQRPFLGPSLNCVFIHTFLSLWSFLKFFFPLPPLLAGLLYSSFFFVPTFFFLFSPLLSMSSPSTSSSSSSQDGNHSANAAGPSNVQRGGDFEGPSSSRRRAVNEVWPEPFVEALATQVAIDASRSMGRLAAAPALANVFQVRFLIKLNNHNSTQTHVIPLLN